MTGAQYKNFKEIVKVWHKAKKDPSIGAFDRSIGQRVAWSKLFDYRTQRCIDVLPVINDIKTLFNGTHRSSWVVGRLIVAQF